MTTSLQTTVNQILPAMVTVMTVNMLASAMGALAFSAAIPAGVKATDRGVKELKALFGTEIVDLAIKNVDRTDIIILAKEVESLYTNRMRKKYGDFATTQALGSAPPGEIRVANEIAAALAGQKVHEGSASVTIASATEAGKKRAKGRRVAQPVKDTTTGITYSSKAKAGMAVAEEYGLLPTNHFAWYEVIKKSPKRFEPA